VTETDKQKERRKSSDEVVNELIEKSGNGFHTKVARYLRENDWTVRLGQYYVDAATDKPREIDLIAERVLLQGRPYRNQVELHLRLIIECKYVPSDVVFWMDAMDVVSATALIESTTPMKSSRSSLSRHHYLQGRTVVAKLFAGRPDGKEDSDPVFRALNQCMGGYVNTGRLQIIDQKSSSKAVLDLSYPIIVFNCFEKFHQINMVGSGPNTAEAVKDNFQFEAHYAYKRENRAASQYMLVDMVSYDLFDRFLASLYKEAEEVMLLSELDEHDGIAGYEEVD